MSTLSPHASERAAGDEPQVRETRLWHAQAHMPTVKSREIVIARGEGAYIWDESGRRMLDTPAALWYCNVGHGRTEIADAAAAQMRQLAAYSSFRVRHPRRSSWRSASRRWCRSTTPRSS